MSNKTAQPNFTLAIHGCLLGTAVGDSLGLPAEGLSRRRVNKIYQNGIRHRFLFGRGMFSDDTEHTLMVAKALTSHPDNSVKFQKALGWSLRWWFLALPAGVGLSTAKAILRLWMGFPTKHSGVRSAGNGAAMRTAIIGVYFADDRDKRQVFALSACRLTHTDLRAEESVLIVSEAASLAAARVNTARVLEDLKPLVRSEEMTSRWSALENALIQNTSVQDYAGVIGCSQGVSGFAPNTVAVAVFAWLRHRGDFERILSEVILCGGDADTVAAIAGGIAGAEAGLEGIPSKWVEGICDWPRSVNHVSKMAGALSARNAEVKIPSTFWPFILLRNIVFLAIVLLHGFRRLLPPY